MILRCDLHIHTALSPCGDMDMTPNNIVNMAQLKGLDVIAITDHNTSANAAAVMECAKDAPLIVIPGMELETSEEAHFVWPVLVARAGGTVSAMAVRLLPAARKPPGHFWRTGGDERCG